MFPQSSGCINNIISTIAIPLVGWMLQRGMICNTEDLVCVMAVLTAVGCHRVVLVHNDDEVNYDTELYCVVGIGININSE